MKLFLVFLDYGYEGQAFVGAYSTKYFAADAIQSLGKPWQEIAWIDDVEVDPWNVPEMWQ